MTVPTPQERAAPVSIEQEIAEVASARALLRSDRPDAALDALQSYERAHPRGVLQQEAPRLRIEALLRVGASRPPKQRARGFLHAHPQSPHAQHVRALLETHANSK